MLNRWHLDLIGALGVNTPSCSRGPQATSIGVQGGSWLQCGRAHGVWAAGTCWGEGPAALGLGTGFPLRGRGRAQWVGGRTRGKPRTGLGGFGEGEKPAHWVSLSGPKEPEIMFPWGRLAEGRGPSLRRLAEGAAGL